MQELPTNMNTTFTTISFLLILRANASEIRPWGMLDLKVDSRAIHTHIPPNAASSKLMKWSDVNAVNSETEYVTPYQKQNKNNPRTTQACLIDKRLIITLSKLL